MRVVDEAGRLDDVVVAVAPSAKERGRLKGRESGLMTSGGVPSKNTNRKESEQKRRPPLFFLSCERKSQLNLRVL